ncbi:MAG TPA: trypsin-like serine protease, partial [Polyangiaceae bacterium]
MSRRSLVRRPWIAFPWIAVAPLLTACTANVGAPEPTGSSASAIYGGVADSDAQQNASVVALEIGSGTMFTLCSGSLVAPNVVLTARHCVSSLTTTAQAQIGCDDDGNSTNGPDFADDQPVANIHVYVGPSIYQNEPVSANVTTIFHMTGTTLCNVDVALVVLDRSITTVPAMRVRLTSPVTTGEKLRAVGFGQNDQNQPIGTRFRKD